MESRYFLKYHTFLKKIDVFKCYKIFKTDS